MTIQSFVAQAIQVGVKIRFS